MSGAAAKPDFAGAASAVRRATGGETTASAQFAAAAVLDRAGVEGAGRDAKLLLQAATGLDAGALLGEPGRRLTARQSGRYKNMVERRAAREPVSRILGRRGFWSLDLEISPATLDPRPDSECLVEAALAHLGGRAVRPRILDLGTGSGCLLLALLAEIPDASGLGTDKSAAALATARANARALGLADRARFVCADWSQGLSDRFDAVMVNPPYIASAEIAQLKPEVACHDPRLALDGGADGLDAYRRIAPHLWGLLAPGGAAFVEVGASQARAVVELLKSAGFEEIDGQHDLAGIERCIIATGPQC
ncbi:MAG TPA: peptide chain release factor N(5)-glutamine methyltransferase [Alphaproteobacteria bacterium]|nr:peptide chain release factor N(5)-glutamine methyltransferase [Alphaproteobacteria bacterium]